jgi:3-dehydroquinate dehydratase
LSPSIPHRFNICSLTALDCCLDRLQGFFFFSIIILHLDFPSWALVLVSLTTDLAVMATSYDKVNAVCQKMSYASASVSVSVSHSQSPPCLPSDQGGSARTQCSHACICTFCFHSYAMCDHLPRVRTPLSQVHSSDTPESFLMVKYLAVAVVIAVIGTGATVLLLLAADPSYLNWWHCEHRLAAPPACGQLVWPACLFIGVCSPCVGNRLATRMLVMRLP